MQQEPSYQQPADRGQRSGWSSVDATFIETAKRVLRPTAERLRCFWCARPLTGGVCPVCDAESAL